METKMEKKTRSIARRQVAALVGVVAIAAALAAPPAAHAQTTTYNVAGIVDYTGPFAIAMPGFDGGRKAVIEWWNTEVGAKLGVKLVYKAYDTRYDAGQMASLWPGIKAELNPIVVMAQGGPDAGALQNRLPDDKIPAMLGLAAYGFAWKEGSWIYNPRPTNSHEIAGFVDWFQTDRLKGARPAKVAIMSAESPSMVDSLRGVQAYLKGNPAKGQIVDVITTEMQPVDLTLPVRRAVNAGADFIVAYGTEAQVVAIKRAVQALGRKIPVVVPSHIGLANVAKTLGTPELVDGDFETGSLALATDDDSPAKQFYGLLKQKYGLNQPWASTTILGMANSLYVVRTVEAAAAKSGPTKLNGEALRAALQNARFGEDAFNGVLPGFALTNKLSFPTAGAKMNIAMGSGGKVLYVARWVAIPTIEKW